MELIIIAALAAAGWYFRAEIKAFVVKLKSKKDAE